MKWTKCSFISPYGKITSNWTVSTDHFELDAVIPPNTSATVYLPGQFTGKVMEGKFAAEGLKSSPADGGRRVKIGSGTYHFTVSKNR